MPKEYVLTSQLRAELKKPLGNLVRGSFEETSRKIKEITQKQNHVVIISVGDTVTRNLARGRIPQKLLIIDNKCMREDVRPFLLPAEKTIHVKNPQGTLTREAMDATREALKGNSSVKIVVDGEEDLLTLPAILFAPIDSYVVYGQPHEGMVIVKVTDEKKKEIAKILEAMEKGSKN